MIYIISYAEIAPVFGKSGLIEPWNRDMGTIEATARCPIKPPIRLKQTWKFHAQLPEYISRFRKGKVLFLGYVGKSDCLRIVSVMVDSQR
jgi:hypothetical protein